jgi:hypothetical protein
MPRRLRVRFRGFTTTGAVGAFSLAGQSAALGVQGGVINASFTLAASNLDATTLAAYNAAITTAERAAIVVAALTGTVVCEIVDAVGVVRASGTMASPWATASGATITVGEVAGQGIDVTSGGAPDGDWYCQFRSGSRFVRGTFGVLGSGRDFVWSLASFQTGSRGALGTVTLAVTGSTVQQSSAIVALSDEAVRIQLTPQTPSIPDWQRSYWTIERSTDGGVTYANPVYANHALQDYIDIDPVPGVTNTYRCKQVNDLAFVASIFVPAQPFVPAAVSAVLVSNVTATSCTLAWTNPTDSKEQWFKVECNDGGSTWRLLCQPFLGTSHIRHVTGLIGGTAGQKLRVKACTSSGESAAVESNTFTTPAYSGSAPAAATNLTAVAGEDTRISLEFRIPDLLSEGAIIEVSSNGGSTWTQSTIYGKFVWRGWVTGLTASTSYQVRVRLFGDGGYAAYSSVASVTTMSAGQVLSPTGRTPRLAWTPHMHQRWLTWKADYESNTSNPPTFGGKMWKCLVDTDALSTGSGTYSFWFGPAAGAILYQVTGNIDYVTRSAPLLTFSNVGTRSVSNNEIRQYGGMISIYNEWMWPGMSDGLRATARTNSIQMWGYGAGLGWTSIPYSPGGNGFGLSLGDSDEMNSQYGLAALQSAGRVPFARGSRHIAELSINNQFPQPGNPRTGFGGLSFRETEETSRISDIVIGRYQEYADGGEWFESSQYNGNSVLILALSLEAAKIARSYDGDNTDYWFNYNRFLRAKSGRDFIDGLSPAYVNRMHWGDEQTAPNLNPPEALTFAMERFGYSAGIENNGALGAEFAPQLLTRLGWNGLYSGSYFGYTNIYRFLTPFDPAYSPSASPSSLVKWSSTNGSGRTTHVDSWSSTASMFWSKCSPSAFVDHDFWRPHDFQLFRKGVRVFTYPARYTGSSGQAPQCGNTLSFAGAGAFVGWNRQERLTNSTTIYGSRDVVRREQDASRSYVCEESWGALSDAYETSLRVGASNVPVPFLHEHTREKLYLPSSGATSDVIVVFDRALVANPMQMGNYANYYQMFHSPTWGIRIKDLMENTTLTKALVEFHMVCETSPTLNASNTSWTTTGGQLAKVDHLFPSMTGQTRYVRNIATPAELLTDGFGDASELNRYAFSVYSATDPWPADATPRWYTLLNVASVRDSGTSVSSSLIQASSGATVRGALISRTGESDVVALFNATPATGSGLAVVRNRDITSTFTVNYTQTTASATVYAHALSTSRSWTVAINGGAAAPITVSSAGVATIAVSSPGSKTLVFA